MKTATYPLCFECNSPILKPENGYIVEGNIYSAQVDDKGNPTGGLVGNNLTVEVGTNRILNLDKVCFCKSCFLRMLRLHSTTRSLESS